MFDPLGTYIEAVKKKKFKEPNLKSYKTIVEWNDNPLSKANLLVFVMIAKTVEPFLTLFQAKRPLTPFLAKELFQVLKHLLEKFIHPSEMLTLTSRNIS